MNVSRTLPFCLLLGLWLATATAGWSQIFRRAYGPTGSTCNDLVETADGGFLMTGEIATDSSLFLQRTGPDGTVVWAVHGHLNGARGIAVCATPGGGFAVLCENYLDAGALHNAILKITGAGAVEWLKVLENPAYPNGFSDIAATAGGGFAVAGTGRLVAQNTDFYARLVKLDQTGNLVWDQKLGYPNNTMETGQRLAELPNGDLVLAGEIRHATLVQGGSDFFLARVSAQGAVLWQKQVEKADYQTLSDLHVSPDGSIALLGTTYHDFPVSVTLLKTDGNGSEIWYKRFQPKPGADGTGTSAIYPCFTGDEAGNYYIPDIHYSGIGTSPGLSLLKMNAAGDSVWTHTSDLTDIPKAVVYTADHQFAFAGGTQLVSAPLAVLIKSDWSAATTSFFSTLSGSVFRDQNANCSPDTGEDGPPLFRIAAENQLGEHFFQLIPATGAYSLTVPPGDYSLTAHPLPGTETLWQVCDTPSVTVSGINQLVQAPPVGVQSVSDCPYLDIELGAGLLRRCTSTVYTAHYCNYGSITATGASVQITADPLLSYVSSSIPLSAQSGYVYTFGIGDVAPGACADFSVIFLVSCAAHTGQTICAEAHIFPDSSCLPPGAQWDGSHIVVDGHCNGNVEFTITNTGNTMAGTTNYVIIEDQIMLTQGAIQLQAGADSVIMIANPTGNSYYIQVEQRPGHPGNDQPAAVADMCNGLPGSSLAMQLPLNQADPFVSIQCEAVVASYDPNDKRGFPLGWHAEHFLENDQEIEYTIRFQNTGNDTAFLIVVRDTLPPELDPLSVRPGASSHPYAFDIAGDGTLAFTFGNIRLPDSTTNEPASHGYVNFTIAQKPDLAPGTVIENDAAIFFDFNEPVLTDPYFHTVGRPLITFVPDRPGAGALELRVFPNPSSEYADFRLEGSPQTDPRLRLRVYDARGRLLQETEFTGPAYRFQRQGLAPGLYYFQLENSGGKRASGKLILR